MASVVDEILRLHRAQLKGLVEIRGVNKMRAMYDQARSELEGKLADMKKRGMGQSFSAHHIREILIQVNDAIHGFEVGMAAHLTANGKLAGTLGARHLVQAVKKLEKKFAGHAPVLSLEQAAVMREVFRKVEPTLLNRYKKSVRLYGKPVVKKIRDQMALSLLQGETVNDAVERVAGTSGIFAGERWRAERIVRTEMSFSYGVVKQRSMEELTRRDVPDMQKKLIATFDDRTGKDSKELHGQTRPVDQPFIWKRRDSKGTVVETVEYMQPPNRPNDREISIPWRPGWVDTRFTTPDETGPGDVTASVPSLTPL